MRMLYSHLSLCGLSSWINSLQVRLYALLMQKRPWEHSFCCGYYKAPIMDPQSITWRSRLFEVILSLFSVSSCLQTRGPEHSAHCPTWGTMRASLCPPSVRCLPTSQWEEDGGLGGAAAPLKQATPHSDYSRVVFPCLFNAASFLSTPKLLWYLWELIRYNNH